MSRLPSLMLAGLSVWWLTACGEPPRDAPMEQFPLLVSNTPQPRRRAKRAPPPGLSLQKIRGLIRYKKGYLTGTLRLHLTAPLQGNHLLRHDTGLVVQEVRFPKGLSFARVKGGTVLRGGVATREVTLTIALAKERALRIISDNEAHLLMLDSLWSIAPLNRGSAAASAPPMSVTLYFPEELTPLSPARPAGATAGKLVFNSESPPACQLLGKGTPPVLNLPSGRTILAPGLPVTTKALSHFQQGMDIISPKLPVKPPHQLYLLVTRSPGQCRSDEIAIISPPISTLAVIESLARQRLPSMIGALSAPAQKGLRRAMACHLQGVVDPTKGSRCLQLAARQYRDGYLPVTSLSPGGDFRFSPLFDEAKWTLLFSDLIRGRFQQLFTSDFLHPIAQIPSRSTPREVIALMFPKAEVHALFHRRGVVLASVGTLLVKDGEATVQIRNRGDASITVPLYYKSSLGHITTLITLPSPGKQNHAKLPLKGKPIDISLDPKGTSSLLPFGWTKEGAPAKPDSP